jgi:hypothetical protein
MFHRAIISGMAVSLEDLAAGALALQVFVKNAKNVEIIVNVAFATIPTVLGLGAAGLLGSGIINTAKEVIKSISLLKTVGPMVMLGGMAGRKVGQLAGQRWPFLQSWPMVGGLFKPPKKKGGENQDTQGKQEEQRSGGSGGSPPPPPDIKPTQRQDGEGRKIILPEDLLKSGELSLEDYLKLQKKLE